LDWILTILYLIVFISLIKRWRYFRHSGISSKLLIVLFVLKFGAGLFLTTIYTHHYKERREADIFKYFDDSAPMFAALPKKPIDFVKMITGIGTDNSYFFNTYFIHMNNWDRVYDSNIYNDSHTIIRLNAVFRIFSFNVFHIHTLMFCFLAFIGSVAYFKAFKHLFSNTSHLFLIACFLLPSVLLWTSGILKESILIFTLGMIFLAIKKITQQKTSTSNLVLIVVCLFLMIYIKFYVLLSFLPAIIGYLIAKKLNHHAVVVYTVTLFLAILGGFYSNQLTGSVDLVEVLVDKQKDFIRLAEWQSAKSSFALTPLENNFFGVVKVVPEGLLNCFVRPLPQHTDNWLQAGVVLENLLLLLLFIFSTSYAIRSKLAKKPIFISFEHKNFFLFCALFTLLLFTIIGITTPVAGALVRYKVPALPFFMMGCLLLLQHENKITNSIENSLNKLFGTPPKKNVI
jgi:hypothetical protein